MALKIVKEREFVEEYSYRLNFDVDDYGGLSFPCDKDGNVRIEEENQAAWRNYEHAVAHPEMFCRPAYVSKRKSSWWEPAEAKCGCGEVFELVNEYMGACECPRCGKWYNMSGQELLPPKEWGWDGTPMDDDY